MKRIIMVSGSPRLTGNTNTILNHLSDKLKEAGFPVDLIYTSSCDIQYCSGCLECEESDCSGNCSIRDEFSQTLVNMFIKADVVIFGTPVYFDMPSALLVNFIDRLNMHLTTIGSRSMWAGVVAVGQTDLSSVRNCVQCIKRFIKIAGMNAIDGGIIHHIARSIGDVDLCDKKLAAKVSKLVSSITSL